MQRDSGREPAVYAKLEGGELTLFVDETVYSREALFRACYWFTDRCYLFVSRTSPTALAVRVRPKSDGLALDSVTGEFENALIDYQVRHDVERETARIRELIVAKAFAEGDVLEEPPVGDNRDPVELAQARAQERRGQDDQKRH